MVTIYADNGAIRYETPINIGSKRVFKLMGDDYIILKFSTDEPIKFKLGDYCDIPGFGRFELIKPYKPNYNKDNGGYDYELQMDAQHIKWRNKIMKYLPQTGAAETSWTLTATPEVHMEQVLANILTLPRELVDNVEVIHSNYLYNGGGHGDYSIMVHSDVEKSAKTIQYDSVNIIDAMTSIAEQYDCEWWIEGNIIHLGKCEDDNEYIDLVLGDNVAEMNHSDSSEKYATRIIPFGSDRNLSSRYRSDLIFEVTETLNSGNDISDTIRPLDGRWFDADDEDIDILNEIPRTVNLQVIAPNLTASATALGNVSVYQHNKSINDVEKGEYTVDFSDFKPTLKCYSLQTSSLNPGGNNSIIPENATWDSRVTVNVKLTGIPLNAGESGIMQTFASSAWIPSLNEFVSVDFENQTINIPNDLSSLKVEVEYFVLMGNDSSVGVEIKTDSHVGCNLSLVLAIPDYTVSHITLQQLDDQGNISRVINDVTYNPDHGETHALRNWLRLPENTTMNVGDRFRILGLKKSKVKSSYFTSTYSAYKNYSNVVVNGIVTKRLMLPEGMPPYIDVEDGLTLQEYVEDVVVFDDVYPKKICRVISVDEVDREETIGNDDKSQTKKTFKAYVLKDDFFNSQHKFDKDYIIQGKTLQVVFQDGYRYTEDDIERGTLEDGTPIRTTPDYEGEVIGKGSLHNPESGKLNGWTFDVAYKDDGDGNATWEIVRNNNALVPNEIIKPEIGDQFVLIGFDTSMIEDLYVKEAEKELLRVARKYVEKLNTDTTTYDCKIMPDCVRSDFNPNGIVLELGTRVNLLNEVFFDSVYDEEEERWYGRKSRVIGFEIPLDIPYDNPVYTIGEKAAYSRLGAIEDSVEALQWSMSSQATILGNASQTGAGNTIYVIGQNDVTPPSDRNVYSSLRSALEFFTRKMAETVSYVWTFLQGIVIGNYAQGSTGAKITAAGDAEFGELNVRNNANIEDSLDVGNDASVGYDLSVGKSISVGGGFVQGAYGGKMWEDAYGNIHIETDYLAVRKKFETKEIEIQEETHVGGFQIISPAAMRCSRVIPIYSDTEIIAYKCCFAAEDNDGVKIHNQFSVDDLARCETFNVDVQSNGMVGNHYYWRKVIEVGYIEDGDDDYDASRGREGYIVLSDVDKDVMSDEPMVGDNIVTMGNADDYKPERQNLIIMSSYGNGSPYIYQYQGINTFLLNARNLKVALSPNGNLFTGKVVIENREQSYDIEEFMRYSDATLQVTNKGLLSLAKRTIDRDGVVEEHFSRLEQTAEMIEGYVESHKGILEDIINGAGRNLLLGTNNGIENWRYFNSINSIDISCANDWVVFESWNPNHINAEWFSYALRPELIKRGETYTLSMEVSDGGNSAEDIQLWVQIIDDDGNAALSPQKTFNEAFHDVKTIHATFTATASGNKNGTQRVRIITAYESTGKWHTLAFRNLKLEKGSTPTAYNPAPEDASDYVDRKLSSQITQTADEIRSEVSQEIDGVRTDMSEIDQRCDSITATVEDYNTNLQSQIAQTADNISLRVGGIEGTRNLVKGNMTGEGWSMLTGSSTILHMVGGVYELSTASAWQSGLMTARFSLKPHTKYIISFCGSVNPNGLSAPVSLKYKLLYGDTNSQLVAEREVDSSEPTTHIYTFETGSQPINQAYLTFYINQPNVTAYVSQVMVVEGDTPYPFTDDISGLLATGIDIKNKQITFTADNMLFQNNNGEVAAMIDENGKISAKHIDVDNLTARHVLAGTQNGQRVEIDPDNMSMDIYGENGNICSSYTGQAYEEGLSQILSDAADVDANLDFTVGGRKIKNGGITLNASDSRQTYTLYSGTFPGAAPDTLPTTTPASVEFVNGSLLCRAHASGFTINASNTQELSTSMMQNYQSMASVQVFVYLEQSDTPLFDNPSSTLVSSIMASAAPILNEPTMDNDGLHYASSDQTNTTSLIGKRATSSKPGFYRIRMTVVMEAKYPGSYCEFKWGNNATNGSNVGVYLSAKFRQKYYMGRFFANGFCLGIDNSRYILAYKDSEEDGENMHFEFQSGGYGFKGSDTGLMVRHHGGNWMNMPMLVYSAFVSYSSGYSAAVKSHLFSNGVPTVTKTDTGKVNISIPTAWKSNMNFNNNTVKAKLMVNLVGYGGSSVSISNMTESVLSLEIRTGNGTLSDGSFMIDIYSL